MIFARFHHIYTHRFESAYGDEATLNQAKREWALSLAGISANLIELGLERCKQEHAWPPTIAEFLRLVQPTPESIGLPSVTHAYAEACRNAHQAHGRQWTHVCVKMAAQSVGYFSLKSDSERLTRPSFEKAYLELIQRLADGEVLEINEAKALPEPNFDEEQALVKSLINAGVSETDAQLISYYLEKPKGSPVRTRYRKHAADKLAQLAVSFDLPE